MENASLGSITLRYWVTVAIVLLLVGTIGILTWRLVRKSRQYRMDQVRDGYEFEQYLAQLLKKHGFTNVDVTKKSGDFGIDIFAEKDEILYAFQCKLYGQPVGVKAVQEVLSGRMFYDCHVGVVATNSTFTKSARELAAKTGVLLWDGQRIGAMAQGVK